MAEKTSQPEPITTDVEPFSGRVSQNLTVK